MVTAMLALPLRPHPAAKSSPHIIIRDFFPDPCRLVQCRAKETCKLEKGEAMCVHDYMGTCMGSQALQYHTFDGMSVDIRGGCAYTVAKYCGNDPTLVPFAVEEKKSQGDLTEWLTNVYVYAYNISINKGEGGKILVGFPGPWQRYFGQSLLCPMEEGKALGWERLKLKNAEPHRKRGE